MKDLLIYRYAEPTIITGIHPDSIESHLLRYYAIESGVNFMEKTIALRNTEITFSIWDLGGHREFISMLPLVCNDAVAILFMFDLSRKATLTSIKEWYRQVRSINKNAFPFLVGMKYDVFSKFNVEEQEDITKQVRLLH
uniref:Septumpromoting GTPbinding protein 1 putative n=1 Tax=Albugo laibachii Nc14 TaxID=890382 RepID=F0W5Z1_9STRA|nr:septumpromoting GTPbinding protein 1 putative [Albugo laibachii Nc14]|eukprot:CCA16532.1 septumpromoting GTPbinding protein 1 putative [Albugo laibachii Nc14]